jgi:hypothetical protein
VSSGAVDGNILGLCALQQRGKHNLRFEISKGSVSMSFSKIATAALTALSLVAVPTIASAAPAASKLSVASARTSAPAKGNKALGGGVIIAVLAAAAVIAGIVIAADSNGSPTSR